MTYISYGEQRKAHRIRIGDVISVTGDRLRADLVMRAEKRGKRIYIRLDNGDKGRFRPSDLLKIYHEVSGV